MPAQSSPTSDNKFCSRHRAVYGSLTLGAGSAAAGSACARHRWRSHRHSHPLRNNLRSALRYSVHRIHIANRGCFHRYKKPNRLMWVKNHKFAASKLSTLMENTLQALAQAAHGLLFMSESDYPLTVLQWPMLPAHTKPVHLLESLLKDAQWEIRQVKDFFGPRMRIEEWMSDQEKTANQRMAEVYRIILELDPTSQVFCSTQNPKQCYVLGKTNEGIWFAVHTQVVET